MPILLFAVLVVLFALALVAVLRARFLALKSRRDYVTTLGKLAHDLRGPLQLVHSLSHRMRRDQSPADLLAYSDSLSSSSDLMARIVDDALKLARGQRLQVVNKPINIAEWFADLVSVFRPLAETKGLEFKVDFLNTVLFINSDSARLRQALSSLLDNAIRYTDSGFVSLSLRVTDVSGDSSLCTLSFEVKDSGRGMAQTPWYKAVSFLGFGDDPATHDCPGLSLRITRSLSVSFGGRFHIDSAPGKGTKVSFSCPAQILTNPAVTPRLVESQSCIDAVGSAPPGQLSCLVADDDPQTIITLTQFLAELNCHCEILTIASQLSSRLLANHFDLVFCGFPFSNVHDLRRPNGPRDPFFVLMVRPGEEVSPADSHYFRCYIKKPLSESDLLSCMDSFGLSQLSAP